MLRVLSFLLLCCNAVVCNAESIVAQDTLESVLTRMQPKQAVKIHYQETRFLALLAEPWQGSGYLYAAAPKMMVKEQWYPQRELMGANADRLLYFDPFANVRHQMTLDPEDSISVHIEAFKAMLTGDLLLMQTFFEIEFKAPDQEVKNWQLVLKAKNNADETSPKISISGPAGEAAKHMTIFLADGDRTEYTFQKQAEGALPHAKITQLLLELQEN